MHNLPALLTLLYHTQCAQNARLFQKILSNKRKKSGTLASCRPGPGEAYPGPSFCPPPGAAAAGIRFAFLRRFPSFLLPAVADRDRGPAGIWFRVHAHILFKSYIFIILLYIHARARWRTCAGAILSRVSAFLLSCFSSSERPRMDPAPVKSAPVPAKFF